MCPVDEFVIKRESTPYDRYDARISGDFFKTSYRVLFLDKSVVVRAALI
jgi:hypothetical protein